MRVRKLVLRSMAVIAVFAILAALSVRWLVKSDPSWYRPMQFDEAAQAQSYKALSSQIVDLSNRVGASKVDVERSGNSKWPAFDVEFTESQINGTISRWQDWPPVREHLKNVAEPHVRFLDDSIELAGRLNSNGPLVSMELSITQTPDGPRVELGRPFAGRMPLTRSPLESFAEEIDGKLVGAHVPVTTVAFLKQLVAGEELTPIVAVPSNVIGKPDFLPAKVEKLTIKDGVLRATLRPFDPKDEPTKP